MWTFAFGDGSLFLFSWSFTPCWYWLEAESWLQAELWTRRSFLFWWIHVSFYTWIWYLITKRMHYRKTPVTVHFELIFHSDFSWKGVLPLEGFCNPDFSVMCRAVPGGWSNAGNLVPTWAVVTISLPWRGLSVPDRKQGLDWNAWGISSSKMFVLQAQDIIILN